MTIESVILISILVAVIAASIGFFAAALLGVGKSRGQYNRGWNAGRDFAWQHPDLKP
jgi:hypothetical protein